MVTVAHGGRWRVPIRRAARAGNGSYICEETAKGRIDGIRRTKERRFADLVDAVSLDLRIALNGSGLLGLFR
jgi:hypothetical protein